MNLKFLLSTSFVVCPHMRTHTRTHAHTDSYYPTPSTTHKPLLLRPPHTQTHLQTCTNQPQHAHRDVLPVPMPASFLLTMIFRLSGKTASERFELIRLDGFDDDDNEVSFFSVVLDGSQRSVSIEGFDTEEMWVVRFSDMQDAYKVGGFHRCFN